MIPLLLLRTPAEDREEARIRHSVPCISMAVAREAAHSHSLLLPRQAGCVMAEDQVVEHSRRRRVLDPCRS